MVVLSLIVAVVALAVAILAMRRADVVEKRARQWRASEGHPDGSKPAQKSATASAADIGTAELNQADVDRRLTALEGRTAGGISRIAVIRYDAFEEVGGQLSYSAALVDAQGRGLVLTAIHGRAETRTYVKQVPQPKDSPRTVDLSPEEREALRVAAQQGTHGAQQK